MLSTTSVLTFLGAATAVLAAPLSARTKDGAFQISGFSDGGSPHSEYAYIRFTVSDTTATTPLANVTCSYSAAVLPTIATIPFGHPCSDPTVVFGVQYAYDDYYLTVAHTYNANTTTDSGAVSLGRDIETFVDTLNPNGNYQYLSTSSSFDIEYNRL